MPKYITTYCIRQVLLTAVSGASPSLFMGYLSLATAIDFLLLAFLSGFSAAGIIKLPALRLCSFERFSASVTCASWDTWLMAFWNSPRVELAESSSGILLLLLSALINFLEKMLVVVPNVADACSRSWICKEKNHHFASSFTLLEYATMSYMAKIHVHCTSKDQRHNVLTVIVRSYLHMITERTTPG